MNARPTSRTHLRFVVLVVALVTLAACTTGPIGQADGELVIGTMLPLTGQQSEAGQAARDAIESRLTEISAATELDGIELRVVHTDVRSDLALVRAAGQELRDNNVDIVIGPPNSPQNDLAADALTDEPAAMYLPISQPIEDQAVMMAEAIIVDGHQVVTLMLPAGTTAAVPSAMERRLEELDGALASAVEFEPAAERFDPEAALVAADDSSAVLIVGAGSPQAIVDGLEAVGAGTEAGRTIYVLGNTASIRPVPGLRVIEPLASLSDRVTDRLIVAALAAALAGTDDPGTISTKLSSVVAGDTSCPSFSTCLTRLRDDGTARFAGAGNNGFAEDGAPIEVPYRMTAFTADGEINNESSRMLTSG